MAAMGADDLRVLNADQWSALSTNQIRAIDAADVGALDAGDLQEFTAAQLKAMNSAQINALDNADWQAFTPTQFAALTTQQIRWMDTGDIAALSNEQIAAMTTAQASVLTTAQIVALTDGQIEALSVADISAMSMTQAAAFSTADYNLMSAAQRSALTALSPIILDLDGNGVSTTSASDGVNFDLAASGVAGRYGWVNSTDALLVRDVNGDGVINDGRELFGSATKLDNGQDAGHGYAALAQLDSNQDGRVNSSDQKFGELKLWVDADHDGLTDIGELRGLVEMGVVSLDLNYATSTRMDNGNAVAMVSGYQSADGLTHEMADVWFAKARTEEPPQIADLLAAPAADLTAQLPPAPATPAPEAAAATAPEPTAVSAGLRSTMEEDLLRHRNTLI